MNDQQFFDLAMKDIAGHTSSAEKADLQAWMSAQPAAKAEYGRLQSQTRMAKEMAPLLQALNHPAPVELPEYARERLNAKLKRTFPKPEPVAKAKWSWQWVLALSACVIVIGLIVVNQIQPSAPVRQFAIAEQPSAPVIQLAMVDTIGNMRGNPGDIDPIKAMTNSGLGTNLITFNDNTAATKWLEQWSVAKKPMVKVIYDRDRGVIRVFWRSGQKTLEKEFPIQYERDLNEEIDKIKAYLHQNAWL